MFALLPYLKHLSIVIVTLVVLFTIGQLLLSYIWPGIHKQKNYLKIFLSLLSGFLFCITLYSLFITGMATVNILLIVVFLLLFVEFYIIGKRPFKLTLNKIIFWIPDSKNIIALITLTVIIYSYESFFVLQNKAFPYVTQFYDLNFISGVIEGFNSFKQESGHFNNYVLYDTAYKGTSLYHVTELWFSALLSFAFQIPSILSLLLGTYPVMIIIYITGLLSLFEIFSKIKYSHFFLAILMLFCGGMYFDFYNKWPLLGTNFIGDSFPLSFLGRKLLIIYIILTVIVHLIIRKHFSIALIFFWSLISLYSTTLPGVFGATVFFLFSILVFKKFFRDKLGISFNPIRIGLYFSIFIFSLFLFNYFTYSSIDIRAFNNTSTLKTSFFSPELEIRSYIIIFIETYFRLFVYYFLYIPLFIIFFRISHKNTFIKSAFWFYFIMLVVGGGIITSLFSVLNHPKMNYWQVLYNYFLPVISVLIIFVFTLCFEQIKNKKIKAFSLILFSLLCSYQFYKITSFATDFKYNKAEFFYKKTEYSETYIEKVNSIFKTKKHNTLGVQFSGKDIHQKNNFEVTNQFLAYNRNYFYPVDLGKFNCNFSIDKINFFKKEYLLMHPFYRFIEKSKNEGSYTNVENEMLKFVQHYDFISYMIVAKDVQIYKPVQDIFELCAEDDLSGERFFIRK